MDGNAFNFVSKTFKKNETFFVVITFNSMNNV